jgi:hypothetical protein
MYVSTMKLNIVTDFLKASLWRQIIVLGARKPSDCTTVEDRFYTTETLTRLYKNRGVPSLDNEFARRVSVTTKDLESILVLSEFLVGLISGVSSETSLKTVL